MDLISLKNFATLTYKGIGGKYKMGIEQELKTRIDKLESAFDRLADEYLNESNNYDRLREFQDGFYEHHKLLLEDIDGLNQLEEFCNSYM